LVLSLFWTSSSRATALATRSLEAGAVAGAVVEDPGHAVLGVGAEGGVLDVVDLVEA
jgi:hypothetical protein